MKTAVLKLRNNRVSSSTNSRVLVVQYSYNKSTRQCHVIRSRSMHNTQYILVGMHKIMYTCNSNTMHTTLLQQYQSSMHRSITTSYQQYYVAIITSMHTRASMRTQYSYCSICTLEQSRCAYCFHFLQSSNIHNCYLLASSCMHTSYY